MGGLARAKLAAAATPQADAREACLDETGDAASGRIAALTSASIAWRKRAPHRPYSPEKPAQKLKSIIRADFLRDRLPRSVLLTMPGCLAIQSPSAQRPPFDSGPESAARAQVIFGEGNTVFRDQMVARPAPALTPATQDPPHPRALAVLPPLSSTHGLCRRSDRSQRALRPGIDLLSSLIDLRQDATRANRPARADTR